MFCNKYVGTLHGSITSWNERLMASTHFRTTVQFILPCWLWCPVYPIYSWKAKGYMLSFFLLSPLFSTRFMFSTSKKQTVLQIISFNPSLLLLQYKQGRCHHSEWEGILRRILSALFFTLLAKFTYPFHFSPTIKFMLLASLMINILHWYDCICVIISKDFFY